MSFHTFLLETRRAKLDSLDGILYAQLEEMIPHITYNDHKFSLNFGIICGETCANCGEPIPNLTTYLNYIRKLEIEQNQHSRRHIINDVKRLFDINMANWRIDELLDEELIIEIVLQNGTTFDIKNFNKTMELFNIKIMDNTLYDYILNNKKQQILKFSKNFNISSDAFEYLNETIQLFTDIQNRYLEINLNTIYNFAQLSCFCELFTLCINTNDKHNYVYNSNYGIEEYKNIIRIKTTYKCIKICDLITKTNQELKDIVDQKFNELQDYYGLLSLEHFHKQMKNYKCVDIINPYKNWEIGTASVRKYILRVLEFDYKMNRPDIYDKIKTCQEFEKSLQKIDPGMYSALVQLSIERNNNSTSLIKEYVYDPSKLFLGSSYLSKYHFNYALGIKNNDFLKPPYDFDYRIKIFGEDYTQIPTKNTKELLPIFEQKLLNIDLFHDNLEDLFDIGCTLEMKENINNFHKYINESIKIFNPELNFFSCGYRVVSIVENYNKYLKLKNENDINLGLLYHPKNFEKLICQIESTFLFDDIIKPIREKYDKLKDDYDNDPQNKSTKRIKKYLDDNTQLYYTLTPNFKNICKKIMKHIPKIPDLEKICGLNDDIEHSDIIMIIIDIYFRVSKYFTNCDIGLEMPSICNKKYYFEQTFPLMTAYTLKCNCVDKGNAINACVKCEDEMYEDIVKNLNEFSVYVEEKYKKFRDEVELNIENYNVIKSDIIKKLELGDMVQINNILDKVCGSYC